MVKKLSTSLASLPRIFAVELLVSLDDPSLLEPALVAELVLLWLDVAVVDAVVLLVAVCSWVCTNRARSCFWSCAMISDAAVLPVPLTLVVISAS
jgi:hypothetical protein